MAPFLPLLLALGTLAPPAAAAGAPSGPRAALSPEPPAQATPPGPDSPSTPRRVAFGILIAAAFVLPAALLLRRRRPPGRG